MSTLQRQILMSMLYSLIFAFILLLLFLHAFPLEPLSKLWTEDIMDIPFILFIPSASLLAGACAGFFNGYIWKRQLSDIGEGIRGMVRGTPDAGHDKKMPPDLAVIYEEMKKLQAHVSEQISVSQKLSNERYEVQEKRIQEIVSEERNRLARELHDSVSQQLFAASMLMSAINENRSGNQPVGKQLKLVEDMIHQSQLEMRALLLHLRPVPLKDKSLKEGIEELLLELKQKVPMKITWRVEEVMADKGVEDHLFRILQESVSNTLRHSKASSLEVMLVTRDNTIILIVSDDGVGFDIEKSKAGSYGLQNMHERALEAGGTLKIVSVLKKGTRLEVKVPVIAKGEQDD